VIWDRITWIVISICAVAGLVLGLYGWLDYASNEPAGLVWPGSYLEAAYRTFALFIAEASDAPIALDDYDLQIARVIAPIAAYGAIIQVGLAVLADRVEAFRIRLMRGHTVICGLNDNALAFARSELKRKTSGGRRVVIVDDKADGALTNAARALGVRLARGDPSFRPTLVRAGMARAARLIVCTGEDSANLEIAMLARAIAEDTGRHGEPLLADVMVRDRQLWRQLTRSAAIERSRDTFEMLPFNLSAWAARQFAWEEPLYVHAALRDQSRIHLVFLGYDDYAEGLIGEIPASCVFRDFDKPLVTLMVADVATARASLNQAYPELDHFAEISLEPFDPATDALTEDSMMSVEDRGAVTAVIICREADDVSLSTGIYVNQTMARTGRWRAPVYVRLSKCDGIKELLKESRAARRFADVVQPFGVEDRLCDVGVVEGPLETIAEQFHQAYTTSRRKRIGAPESQARHATLTEWRGLDETFRAANRRASDHVRAKLASVGCRLPTGYDLKAPNSFRLWSDNRTMETLADLEHRSWVAGRYVEGWRAGAVRDDQRRIHDCLGPYAELTNEIQEYDRDQIVLIGDALLERTDDAKGHGNLVRATHVIGLIGKNRLDDGEARWLDEQVAANVIPALVERDPDADFVLLTPLAPGADLILCRAVHRALTDSKSSLSRLIVEAVPEAHMLDDYRDHCEAGAAWDLRENAPVSETAWPAGRDAIAKARQALIESETTDWLLDLTDPQADYRDADTRRDGYSRAADYITRHATTLIAAHRPAGEAGAPAKPGGVADTLARRQAMSHDGPWLPRSRYSTVILDLDAREVREVSLSQPD
jgi:voltage-gated potassium channel Kch